MTPALRTAWLLILLTVMLSTGHGLAADKRPAALFVKDALTVVHQAATIEARLVSSGLLTQTGLGGEPLELVVNGRVVATAMTGGDGIARLSYAPPAQGLVSITVRVGDSPRAASAQAEAHLAVWERRSPIVAVEQSALMETPVTAPLPGAGLAVWTEAKPLPDAAEELAKLTQFYYRVIYIVPSSSGSDGFQAAAVARDWLNVHHFPPGYVLVLPPGDQALGQKIDELHASGWKTVKIGIGRSKSFAEAFLQRRLEAVMVPEPKKGEAPRKAKVAKDWKEVRKKF